MTSTFDYSSFKNEFVLNDRLRELCTALRQAQNHLGQPLFPDAPDGQVQNPLQALVARLNLNQELDADPVFDFECNGLTVEDWATQCRTHQINGVPAPRNLMEWMQARGGRLYYVSAGEPGQNNVQWTELTRPESSDSAQEHSEIIFLDTNCTVADWRSSLANLKRLGLDRKYTFEMMRTALLRILSRLMPEQIQLLQDRTANQIAVFLLKLDGRTDKLTLYRQQLLVFQRKAHEDLISALARLENLVEKMHPAAEPDNLPFRDQIFRTALISLTPDIIAVPLMEDIKRAKMNCTPMTLQDIRRIVLTAEKKANVILTAPLSFGRLINNMPLESLIQLNSMHCGVSFSEQMHQPPPPQGHGGHDIQIQLTTQQQQHQQHLAPTGIGVTAADMSESQAWHLPKDQLFHSFSGQEQEIKEQEKRDEWEQPSSNPVSLNSTQFRDNSRSRHPSRKRDNYHFSERGRSRDRHQDRNYRSPSRDHRQSKSRDNYRRDNSRSRHYSRSRDHSLYSKKNCDKRDYSRGRKNYSDNRSRSRCRDKLKHVSLERSRQQSRDHSRDRDSPRGRDTRGRNHSRHRDDYRSDQSSSRDRSAKNL
jgi:hypothetical protein